MGRWGGRSSPHIAKDGGPGSGPPPGKRLGYNMPGLRGGESRVKQSTESTDDPILKNMRDQLGAAIRKWGKDNPHAAMAGEEPDSIKNLRNEIKTYRKL